MSRLRSSSNPARAALCSSRVVAVASLQACVCVCVGGGVYCWVWAVSEFQNRKGLLRLPSSSCLLPPLSLPCLQRLFPPSEHTLVRESEVTINMLQRSHPQPRRRLLPSRPHVRAAHRLRERISAFTSGDAVSRVSNLVRETLAGAWRVVVVEAICVGRKCAGGGLMCYANELGECAEGRAMVCCTKLSTKVKEKGRGRFLFWRRVTER